MAKREMPKHEVKVVTNLVGNTSKKVEPTEEKSPVLLKVSNCSKLNVREAPTRESKILTVINEGTIVRVIGMDNGWLHIDAFGDVEKMSPNSRPGYILAQYTSDFDKEA